MASTPSSVPDVLAPGPDLRFLRDQPGTRLRRGGRALREPAQRLLAAAARRGLHAAPLRPAGAVLAARARLRRHECGRTARRPGLVTCAAATSTSKRSRSASAPSRRARLRSSGRRRIAGSIANASSSARSCARSARPGSSSCRRHRRRTRRCRTPSVSRRFARSRRGSSPLSARRCGRRARPRRSRAARAVRRHPVPGTGRGGARPAVASTPARVDEQALRRELHEEVGLRGVRDRAARLRAPRSRSRGRSGSIASETRFYLVRVDEHEPVADDRSSPRRAWPRSAGGRSTSSPHHGSSWRRLTSSNVCVVWLRDRRPRHRAPARRRHLVRRLDGARLRRRARDSRARRRAARARDEGARAALAAARLRRTARRGAHGRHARLTRVAEQHRVPGRLLDEGRALPLPARGLVPAQLRARPAAASRDPRRPRAAHQAARSSSSAGSAIRSRWRCRSSASSSPASSARDSSHV